MNYLRNTIETKVFLYTSPSLLFEFLPMIAKMASLSQSTVSSVQAGRRKEKERMGDKMFSLLEVLFLLWKNKVLSRFLFIYP